MDIAVRAAESSSASPRTLPAGARVARFEIVRVLADTSLSVVYLAIDHQPRHGPDREVVLKEYLPQQLTRREAGAVRPRTPGDAAPLARGLAAFVGEAALLMRLADPSLVHVDELVEANATAYQVMAHRGGSLLLHVRQEMRVPPDESALRMLLDGLLDALAALHAEGVLHGAVAPDNILLLAGGQPLLLGPQQARAAIASDRVQTLMAVFEPSFAAPEQRKPSPGQPLGAWTDLYSLAETIRFGISGEQPPAADGLLGLGGRETMASMLRRRFGNLPAVRYSAELITVLDAALEPGAGARPQSVVEFRDALGAMPLAAQADAWIGSKPPGRRPPGARIEPAFDAKPMAVAATPTPGPPAPAPAAMPMPMPAAPAPAIAAGPRRARPPLWVAGALALVVIAALSGWWWRSQPPAIARLPAEPPTTAIVAAPEPTPTAPAEITAPMTSTPPVATLPPVPAAATIERNKPTSPRDACAGRTQFALYRCMQTQCALKGWSQHPQCVRLRATDSVE